MYPDKRDIESVWLALLAEQCNPVWVKLNELAQVLPDGGSDRTAGSCIYALQREGYVRRIHASERTGRLRLTGRKPPKALQGLRGTVYESFTGRIGDDTSTVYSLSPEDQSTLLGMSREQYMAVMRALHEMGYINWDPPDRIGGVELLRSESFVDIDEEKILARRAFELKKVDLMRSYARSECRRKYLIEYFGQQAPWEWCGNCDQCQVRAAIERGEICVHHVSDEELLIVRKVLACLARMIEHAEGKWFANTHFSPNWIVEVLVGDEKRVKRFGFHHLSTFGLLSGLQKTMLMKMLDELFHIQALDEQYVTRDINGRQITYKEFGLSEVGRQIMVGNKRDFYLDVFQSTRQKKSKRSKKNSPTFSSVNMPVLEALKELRRILQVVVHSTTSHPIKCEDIAEIHPNNLDELGQISGMGPHRLKRYGKAILDVLKS